MENVTIGLAIIAGFLSFISPCVLPLVPAYIGYMGGRMTHNIAMQTSSGATQNNTLGMRLHLLMHGLAFVAGFTLVFVIIGILTTALVSVAGQYVNTFTESIGRIGGVVIIFFGLQFMGILPRFFSWLRQKNASMLDNVLFSVGFAIVASILIYWGLVEQMLLVLPLIAVLILTMFIKDAFTQPAVFWNNVLNRIELMLYSDTRGEMEPSGREGLLGSAFMGMVFFPAGWTPCIGPLLGTILTVAATTGDVAQGMLMLTAYSIGLGIPFVITALLMNSAQGVLRRLQRHMHKIELISGMLLIAIGIMVASGQLQALSQTFSQGDFADFTFRVEECGIGFIEGELSLSHVGSCLSGALAPIAINQSASGNFTADTTQQEYLFHAEANTAIDFKVRSVNEAVPNFTVILYSPTNEILAESNRGDSIISDEKYYPIANLTLEEDGLYRIVIANASDNSQSRFRVKVRESEPLEQASVGAGSSLVDVVASGQIGGDDMTQVDGTDETGVLAELSDTALNSITEVADNLDPAIGLAEGNRAPDFTVQLVNGEAITLSELRGNVVLLNFWGTWCGPCRREMPEFQQAYERFNEDGFEILAVSFDDTVEAIASFRDEFSLTFPLALDDTGEINDAYAIQTRPSSFLLDQNGVIIVRHFGMMTDTQIQEMLTEVLIDND